MHIPHIDPPELYTEADFIDSDFVVLENSDLIEVEMQYPIQGWKNAEHTCFVREEVKARLEDASKRLPTGYRLKIFDAWRPFALQRELYEGYALEIIERFSLQDASLDEQREVVRRFVSEPVMDAEIPPVHCTGGAVDLTVVDDRDLELDMGTPFDWFGVESYTAHYENELNKIVRKNRQMLYQVMTKAGFVNLPTEWWHYDFGDRFWAYYTKKPAMYSGRFERPEV